MKLKKLHFIMMVFLTFILIGSVASADEYCWYECDISTVGMFSINSKFLLSGTKMYANKPGAGSINWWYEIHPDALQSQKEMLAIALTAVSLGKKVQVVLMSDVSKSIYVICLKM